MLQKSTSPGAFDRQAYLIALLVFIAGSTNAAIVPFIGFYIIQWVGVLSCCYLLDEIRTRSKLIEVGGAVALAMMAALTAPSHAHACGAP